MVPGVTVAVVEASASTFWSLGAEAVHLGVARGSRRPGCSPSTPENFLHHLRPSEPGQLTALLDDTRPWCRRAMLDAGTPPWVAAELVLRGWALQHQVQLVLPATEPLRAGPTAPPPTVPRPVAEGDWPAIRAMLRADHREEDARAGVGPRAEARTDDALRVRRSLAAHADYRVVVDGDEPVGFACGWADPAGVGVVEDVFVASTHRRRGLAAALIAAAVDGVRADGAGPVVIAADPTDRPKDLYRLLGFVPFLVTRTAVAV